MKYLVLALSIALTFAFAACGKNGGDSAAPVPAPTTGVPPIGGGPTGPTVTPQSCQVGQLYNSQYGCLFTSDRCSVNQGWVPGQFICVPGTLVTEQTKYGTTQAMYRFRGNMQIVNQEMFNLLLRYAGRCEPYQIGIYLGAASCSYWSKQGIMEITVYNPAVNAGLTDVNISISASNSVGTNYNYPNNPYMYYGQNPYGGYPYSGGGNYGYPAYTYQQGMTLPPISQQARVYPYNNSQGIQIVAINYAGQSLGLQAIVDNGTLNSASFTARLIFQQAHFATVTFQRY